eukprot:8830550-Ditylum_brightwellii.AAC.1
MKLYPHVGVGGICPEVQNVARDPKGHLFDYTDAVLLKIFKQPSTGKAAGPFADIIDTLQDVASEWHNLIHTKSNVQITWQYLRLFARNTIPSTIQQAFSSVWLTLLHKEWPLVPNKPPKFRPIGPGSGSRHAATAIVTKAERKPLVTECIHRNNLGIGVRGGSQFVAVSIMA